MLWLKTEPKFKNTEQRKQQQQIKNWTQSLTGRRYAALSYHLALNFIFISFCLSSISSIAKNQLQIVPSFSLHSMKIGYKIFENVRSKI